MLLTRKIVVFGEFRDYWVRPVMPTSPAAPADRGLQNHCKGFAVKTVSISRTRERIRVFGIILHCAVPIDAKENASTTLDVTLTAVACTLTRFCLFSLYAWF